MIISVMNIRVSVVAGLVTALLVGLTISVEIHAQARDVTRPWIAVAVPVAPDEDTRSQALAVVIADNLELTLRLIGRYVVRPRPTTRTQIVGVAAAASLAETEQLDYVVFGEVSVRNDGTTVFSLSVYSREEDAVTLERDAVAVSLFDTFDVADELAAELLGAFSGQRIAYGRIDLVNTAATAGEYLVILDGTVVGRTLREIDRVLVGNRRVEIEVLEGPSAGERVFAQTILVSEDGREEVRFSVGIPEIEDAAKQHPVLDEVPTEEPAVAEPVPPESTVANQQGETDAPRGWSRQTAAVPGRAPIVAIVPGFVQWNFPQPERERSGFASTSGVTLSVDVDFPRFLLIGGGIRTSSGNFFRGFSYESTEAGLQALIEENYTVEVEASNTIFLHGGIRLLERNRRAWRQDISVLGTLGYTETFYLFRLPNGDVIDTAFGTDLEWMSQNFASAGGRVMFRAHHRRLTVRFGLDVQYNWPAGQRILERDIYLWNSETDQPGYEPTGIPYPRDAWDHLNWGWDVGIGFSFSGQSRQ